MTSNSNKKRDKSECRNCKIYHHSIDLRFHFVLDLSHEQVRNIVTSNFLTTNSLLCNTFKILQN